MLKPLVRNGLGVVDLEVLPVLLPLGYPVKVGPLDGGRRGDVRGLFRGLLPLEVLFFRNRFFSVAFFVSGTAAVVGVHVQLLSVQDLGDLELHRILE